MNLFMLNTVKGGKFAQNNKHLTYSSMNNVSKLLNSNNKTI
jgi:hypothetical protein